MIARTAWENIYLLSIFPITTVPADNLACLGAKLSAGVSHISDHAVVPINEGLELEGFIIFHKINQATHGPIRDRAIVA